MDTPHYVMMKIENGIFDFLTEVNRSEIRILKYLLEHMHCGNVCYDRQIDIADTLDLDRPYTSRCMTHLRNLEIFKKYRHGVMINPEYFFAGSLEDKPKLHAMYNKLGKQEESIDAEDY